MALSFIVGNSPLPFFHSESFYHSSSEKRRSAGLGVERGQELGPVVAESSEDKSAGNRNEIAIEIKLLQQ